MVHTFPNSTIKCETEVDIYYRNIKCLKIAETTEGYLGDWFLLDCF